MKKEVLIAVLSGLIIGLIITVGIYTANRSLEQQKAKKISQTQTPQPTPQADQNQKLLTITSHENFDLIDQSEITLSGIAWPDAVVALMTEKDNQITTADSDGIFSFKSNLIKGYNEISLVAADETGTTQTQNLVLTYSTTKIELPEWKKS